MIRYLPRRPTEDEMTVAALTSDGMHIEGWVKTPAGNVWTPEDLLWRPPSATKATDIDRAGRIVDVTLAPGEEMAWVRAEINKRERYLDALRAKVRTGALKLSAWLAGMLGLDFDEGVELMPRTGSGTMVALKSLQDAQEPRGAVWTPRKEWVH